jgi:hypothetical protein
MRKYVGYNALHCDLLALDEMCCDAGIASFKMRLENLSSSKLSLTALVLGVYWWDIDGERACLVAYVAHRD